MKTAIIVGAAGGMGRAVAISLALKGYSLKLIDCDTEALGKLHWDIQEASENYKRQHGGKTNDLYYRVIPLDISNKEKVTETFNSILEHSFTKVDLLFSSAGVFSLDKNLSDQADMKRLFDVNYYGNMNCVNAILPYMRAAKCGQIVVIGSRGANFPRIGSGIYSGSKAALQNTLESLAKSAIADGVKITVIDPAITNTPMASISSMPTEAMIQPEDIARTVKYLLKLTPGAVIPSMTIACGLDMQNVAQAEANSAYKPAKP